MDRLGSTQPSGGRLCNRRAGRANLSQVVAENSRKLQRRMLLQRFLGGIPGAVIPEERHEAVGKESGELAHVERWNNTLRQRLARFVRKTLSFSKSDEMHEICLRLFIHRYNLSLLPT